MAWYEESIWCEGCGIEITGRPVVVTKRIYCCQDCARGIRCNCSERMEMDDSRRNAGEPSTTTNGYIT